METTGVDTIGGSRIDFGWKGSLDSRHARRGCATRPWAHPASIARPRSTSDVFNFNSAVAIEYRHRVSRAVKRLHVAAHYRVGR